MSLRDASRREWMARQEPPTESEIQTGALQRIADATETMAQNYAQLIAERDSYKRRYAEERAAGERLVRSNVALRGVITRLRRELGR